MAAGVGVGEQEEPRKHALEMQIWCTRKMQRSGAYPPGIKGVVKSVLEPQH